MPALSSVQQLVPDFRVTINNADLPQAAAMDLISVKIDLDVDVPGMFALTFINWDVTRQDITWSDDALMAVGNPVVVSMGYLNNVTPLISGEITGLEPIFTSDAIPTVIVRGMDFRHRLLRGRKSRTFVQAKDSEIASQIASDAGLTATVEDTQVTLEHVYQHNQTDMEFLQYRARRIGYELGVDDKTILFRPPSNNASATLSLALNADLLEFSARLTTLTQVTQVESRGWDVKQKQVIQSVARSGDENSQMGGSTTGIAAVNGAFGAASQVQLESPASSQDEADRIARGRLNATALEYIYAEGTCYGTPDLTAGIVIQINGVGQRFSGPYYVTSATHTYTTQRGYLTHFMARRNAT